MSVLLWSWILLLSSGVGAVLLSRAPKVASLVGAFGSALACAVALPFTVRILVDGGQQSKTFAWDSVHGTFVIGIDALSAFFLLPVLTLSCLAAIYGFDYLRSHRRQSNFGGAWFYYCLFVAGMILVLLARTVVVFLIAWEVMSLAAFALVTVEYEKEEVRSAGWIYLVAAQLGVAALLAAFLLLGARAGSLDFAAFEHLDTLRPSSANLVFVLALVGFGTKAGLVPLHVWLPEAHPAAPSHVSALMSGVMIKMGIYGLLRFATFLGNPAAWWGVCLAAVGLISGLRPRVRLKRPEGLFPTRSEFQADSPDPVSRSVYEPLFARLANRCAQLRVLQQGQTHLYLANIIVTVVVGLSWAWAWRWPR
jgi:formate hydrogenlyase subunit 3/multisubunit Na+/H+ antiporter MnhD subunit